MIMSYDGFTTCSKTTPSGLPSGGGGSSTGAGASSSQAGSTSSTNPSDGIAIIARNIQISRDLDDNSLISKYAVQSSILEPIKQRFPLKDPQNVPNSVTLYVSFYNLKCKTLIELTALKDLSIQGDSALTSRIAKLDNMSNECSQRMDQYEKSLNRDSKRFISNNFKKKA